MMTPFLKEVAEDLVEKLGADLQNAAIVFNNKRPDAYVQQHLANVIQKPFFSPSFYTIQEFFALSSKDKVADQYTQFFTLLNAWNALVAVDGGEKMDPARFYPLARIILSDFSQIDNDLVNADTLFSEMEDIAEINLQFDYLTEEQQEFLTGFWASYTSGKQKKQQEQFIKMWCRMPKLYEKFHAGLKEKGLTTFGLINRMLAEGKATKPDFIEEFAKAKLVFVGFNALNRCEAAIFKKWQEEGKALFYFDTDSYYLENESQEAGLFLRKNLRFSGLKNEFDNARAFIKANPKSVKVYKTQGKIAEAKILATALQEQYPKLATADNAGKIAIILADESLLLPVLQTIPTHYTLQDKEKPINLNITMGYPLSATSLYGLADLWLTIQQQLLQEKKHTVNHKEVEAFLSHPLTSINEMQRNKIQEKLLSEQLGEVPLTRLVGQKGLFELFFTKITAPENAAETLQNIFKYVLDKQLVAKTLKQTEADLFVALIKELNRLHDTLKENLYNFDNDKAISFTLKLIQKAVMSISVPLSGEPLQGIQVMGLLESRNLDFEEVYILGANEGNLPQTAPAPSFIPDSIRRAYGLPVIENLDAISAYMFYRLMQRSEKVNIVYNTLVDASNSGEPSRFLKQLEYESGFTFNYIEHHQPVTAPTKNTVTIVKDEQVMKLLNKYLTGEKKLSASALTSYINCPLQFFYKYVAGIQEPEEISDNVEANYIGSMLHHVLENFYSNLLKSDPLITKEIITTARKEIPQLAVKAFSFILFKNEGHVVQHSGMQKVVLAIVEKYANIILDYDTEQAPFEIIALEQWSEVPFIFQVNGIEKRITLHGVIDRIDKKNNLTRIVDYKTGSDVLRYNNLEDVFDTNGKNQNKALIQTLFYTYIFEQATNQNFVEPNLYSIRNIGGDGVYFLEGKDKTKLNGTRLQEVKIEFIHFVSQKLSELFDPEIPFLPSENEGSFAYSPYLILCGR